MNMLDSALTRSHAGTKKWTFRAIHLKPLHWRCTFFANACEGHHAPPCSTSGWAKARTRVVTVTSTNSDDWLFVGHSGHSTCVLNRSALRWLPTVQVVTFTSASTRLQHRRLCWLWACPSLFILNFMRSTFFG